MTRADQRRLAPGDNAERDALVARRLEPVRVEADLLRTERALAACAPDTTVAIVAIAEPNAVALCDGPEQARAFVRRFLETGCPSLWPMQAVIGLRLFAIADAETVAGIARGRWYLPAADGADRLVDPTQRPAVPGGRAARRRGGRTA